MSLHALAKPLVVASIVGLALSGATAASAVPVAGVAAEENVSVQATRGFDVINESKFTFVLRPSHCWSGTDKVDCSENEFELPELGSRLEPGGSLHFEVKAWGDYSLETFFRSVGADPWTHDLIIDMRVSLWSRAANVTSSLVDFTRHNGEIRLFDAQ